MSSKRRSSCTTLHEVFTGVFTLIYNTFIYHYVYVKIEKLTTRIHFKLTFVKFILCSQVCKVI